MKGNKIYILLLCVFLLLVFLYQYFSPQEFVWNPTFNKYDKQPFGSYVFDDVMSASFADYNVENKTFYQLYKEAEETKSITNHETSFGVSQLRITEGEENEEENQSFSYLFNQLFGNTGEADDLPLFPLKERRAFLVTEDRISFAEIDVMALLNLLKQGHKIMLCLHSFPQILCDSIYFSYNYDDYSSVGTIVRFAREGQLRDSLYLGTDSLRPERIYAVYPHLHPVVLNEGRSRNWFENDSIKYEEKLRCDRSEIWVRNKDGKPLAFRLEIGKGELFLVATPLMFTNYGMLDGDNASYAFRLLSPMKEMPLTRIEAYNPFVNQASGSPLWYLLSQPPLRWALYTALITILLCMFFTAKRRQRVIPVVRPPANETLRFTQLIGNLYYQRKDYKDMLQKKYLYFCTEVKQLNGLDLHSDEPDEELCRRLADKMGQDFEKIWPVFKELKELLKEGVFVDETSMMRLIDKMNEWRLQFK